jgi:hypothetical protein
LQVLQKLLGLLMGEGDLVAAGEVDLDDLVHLADFGAADAVQPEDVLEAAGRVIQ